MRRSTTSFVIAALLLAGCGTESGGGSGATVSPSDCASVPELHASDSGRTVCLAVGGTVQVGLDGTKSRPWRPVKADGSGLEAVNGGFVLLPGDANAAFRAESEGQVRLSSSRPLCADDSGRVACQGIQEWWVTVVVK
ncbi:hypothetical protein SAMN06272735_5759 [Streptomyces sp. TLI_55]|uniref:hypothetical protein n=1 Tax=Streptomyces sp. TLI_55 TaxID=1938861 RepID=UPI000BD14529|nr:hypothetical protein [Streptomyces sp. TLI_55]SNX63945.1 hypothetical protein SAMN06272735_5759 [Streptomyces sp. TLI_55]